MGFGSGGGGGGATIKRPPGEQGDKLMRYLTADGWKTQKYVPPSADPIPGEPDPTDDGAHPPGPAPMTDEEREREYREKQEYDYYNWNRE